MSTKVTDVINIKEKKGSNREICITSSESHMYKNIIAMQICKKYDVRCTYFNNATDDWIVIEKTNVPESNGPFKNLGKLLEEKKQKEKIVVEELKKLECWLSIKEKGDSWVLIFDMTIL